MRSTLTTKTRVVESKTETLEAERVDVRHFMARFPAIPPMRRVTPDLHQVTVRLPHGARVEYKLAAHTGDRTTEIVDPFNPHRATDPFGANSVAFAPGYATPWWATPSGRSAGSLRRGFVQSVAFERRRFVRWYHPLERGASLPLLVVHDGNDFIWHADLVQFQREQ